MYIIVLCLAVFVISIGLSVVILPSYMKELLSGLIKLKFLWLVSALRLILGVVFLLAANECRFHLFIAIIGLVLIIAGVLLPLLGRERIQKVASTMLSKPDWFWRIAGFIGFLFGIMLALAGMPA